MGLEPNIFFQIETRLRFLEARLAKVEAALDKQKPVKRATQGGQDWWKTLEADPLYQHVNFAVERDNMARWLKLPKNVNRKLTRAFVMNWLNKVEVPVTMPPGASPFTVGPKALIKVTANQVEGVPPPPGLIERIRGMGKSM